MAHRVACWCEWFQTHRECLQLAFSRPSPLFLPLPFRFFLSCVTCSSPISDPRRVQRWYIRDMLWCCDEGDLWIDWDRLKRGQKTSDWTFSSPVW
jgi:hypothetical protein